MSVVGDIFGGGAAFDFFSNVIDKIWPDKDQADKAKLAYAQLVASGEAQRLAAETGLLQGQLEVNKAEAGSTNPFASGWRPSIGWTCAAALFFQFVVSPLGLWVSEIVGHPLPAPPTLDSVLWELLFGMLGIGTLRTVEKIKGVA